MAHVHVDYDNEHFEVDFSVVINSSQDETTGTATITDAHGVVTLAGFPIYEHVFDMTDISGRDTYSMLHELKEVFANKLRTLLDF